MKPILLFCEYRVAAHQLDAFMEFMKKKQLEMNHRGIAFEVYEGKDQPGLFVEMVTLDEGFISSFKQERLDSDSSWEDLHKFIDGGSDKLRMWTFEKRI